jgi:ATP-binding cassette, subfamily C, bacterial LapB
LAQKPAESGGNGWLRPVVEGLGPALPELALLSLFVNLLALAAPIFVLQVYDRVIFHAGLTTLEALAIGMAAVILFDFILRQARARLLQGVALGFDVGLGRRLFEKVASLPLRLLESRPSHSWQFLFRDLETVRNTVSGATMLALVDLPFIIFFLALILWLAPPLAWVFGGVILAFIGLAVWNALAIGQASLAERQAGMRRDRLLNEIVLGRGAMKALALMRPLQARWEADHAGAIRAALKRGGLADGSMNLSAGLSTAATVALTGVGALAILDQEMTVGALVAANLLASRFIAPLSQLVANWRAYSGFRESAKRLADILAEPGERVEATIDRPRPTGRVQLENIQFRYTPLGVAGGAPGGVPEAAPVLDKISVRFGPGGMHGIVGANGSGKTTLLKVIQGLYAPDQGRVLLDEGDIAQYSRAQLAAWIGYVQQDGFLFSGTVRENIARFQEDVTDAEILKVAELSDAHGFISELPDGYGTELAEGGGRLSTGQRQRIIIARALLGDPPVLLLDEPTSNLDRQAETNLAERLRRLAADHTIVVVTHSPKLLGACDSVTVMAKGQIAMAGRADQVLPKLMANPASVPPVVSGPASGLSA